MRKHRSEIIRWANMPDGTKAWYRGDKLVEWALLSKPSWYESCEYIVDDEWSTLRKAQADGKQLQYLDVENEWEDRPLMKTSREMIEYWRIKPEEVYEWQYTTRKNDGYWTMTTRFYTEDDHITEYNVWTKFEPSKRIRK